MSNGDRADKLLAKQLRWNQGTWAALRQQGVAEGTERDLDFTFDAPDEERAVKLASWIQENTDYEARTESSRGGILRRATWMVKGKTRGTKMSQGTLDEWVTRMVQKGFEFDCEFDGWGTFA